MEKKNFVAGASFVFLCLLIGFAFHLIGHDEDVKQLRGYWKAAHVHGMGFAFLNLFYGLLILNIKPKGKLIAIGSMLAVVGVIVFPTSLFLGGFIPIVAKVSLVGTISMAVAWLLMIYTLVAGREGGK